jgi:hypothetical protein
LQGIRYQSCVLAKTPEPADEHRLDLVESPVLIGEFMIFCYIVAEKPQFSGNYFGAGFLQTFPLESFCQILAVLLSPARQNVKYSRLILGSHQQYPAIPYNYGFGRNPHSFVLCYHVRLLPAVQRAYGMASGDGFFYEESR